MLMMMRFLFGWNQSTGSVLENFVELSDGEDFFRQGYDSNGYPAGPSRSYQLCRFLDKVQKMLGEKYLHFLFGQAPVAPVLGRFLAPVHPVDRISYDDFFQGDTWMGCRLVEVFSGIDGTGIR